MVPINFHHLYYFWVAAREGSIAAATRRLYLSQPALSAQLKSLEGFCKARLLERGRRGVQLTFEGRLVYERCERIFAEGEELAAMVRGGFQVPSRLRIGVAPTVSREVVLRILEFLQAEDPALRVAVFGGETEALLSRLRRQAIDLLVANEDCSAALGEGARSRLVGRMSVHFVANRAVRRQIRAFPEDLARAGLLLRPEGHPVRRQVDEFLSRRRVKASVEADSDDVDLLRRLALKGRGVAALSALAVAPELRAGRLFLLHRAPLGIEEQVWFARLAAPRAGAGARKALEAAMSRFRLPRAAWRARAI